MQEKYELNQEEPLSRLEQAKAAMRYLGEKIHEQRILKGMSIDQLAALSEVAAEDVEKAEQGIDTGSAVDIFLLAETLGINFADLMTEAIRTSFDQPTLGQ